MAKVGVIDKDRGWKDILRRIEQQHGHFEVKVGVLGDTPTGAAKEPGSNISVAENAVIQTFGTSTIPARPFLQPTFDRERENLLRMAKRGAGDILDGTATVPDVLGKMGLHLATKAKRYITSGSGVPPPNAPSTIRAKAGRGKTARFFNSPARTIGQAFAQVGALGAVRTLVDTAKLLGAITWMVARSAKKGD